MVDPVLHAVSPLGGHAVLADADPAALGATLTRTLGAPESARTMAARAAVQASRHTPDLYAAAVEQTYRYARSRATASTTNGLVAGRQAG
jgi:hypothetical protein